MIEQDKIYVSSSGDERNVEAMATTHIQNSINKIERLATEGVKLNSVDNRNLENLKAELGKRNVDKETV